MKIHSPKFRVLVLALAVLFAARGRAQAHKMENRFLFVIDTASAMKSRTNGVDEAVIGLLESDIKSQLRKGDTIGLWSYSDHLDADFPMQVWSETNKDGIIREVREHLRTLHYGGRAHLEKVMPAINQAVAHSERLTVFLIFDGRDSIKGTSFDKDVNDLDKHYASEFKAAHEPFVTVLAGRNGAFFDYTINYPNTVVVPPTADPLPPPETNAPPPVAVAAPPPAVINAPAEPRPPRHRVEITLIGSNSVHHAAAPPPAATAAVVAPPPPAAAIVVAPPVVISNAPPPVKPKPLAVQVEKLVVAPPNAPPPNAPPRIVAEIPVAPKPLPPAQEAQMAAAVPVAPAAASISAGQQVALFIAAFSLLTIAVVLVIFLVKRSRGGSQTSLISQSIDRTR